MQLGRVTQGLGRVAQGLGRVAQGLGRMAQGLGRVAQCLGLGWSRTDELLGVQVGRRHDADQVHCTAQAQGQGLYG